MVAKYIRFFNEIHIEDVSLVGGKNASLGEMFQELTALGVRVPNGFAVTAEAYRTMLDKAEAWEHLHEALDGLNPELCSKVVYGRVTTGLNEVAYCCYKGFPTQRAT
ncbi:PEP/pyruvate-binding domain-containing protein [Acidithiobacillus thiooxidans]|uniref:PEP/pyruvate-binding domain-containing protein n=1 Tax=Acidithiobacillus thiooxidans TaxID=930 RepID=UPI00129D489E|nr:PEP/pyruvate-binding domain-containing protein [Acidithiobacillus thiooxidans]